MTVLRGCRVLVVEDEPILSLELQDVLSNLECEVAGSAGRLPQALELARTLDFDLAILDVNLGGVKVDPVVDVLDKRKLPYLFVTGYGGQRTGCNGNETVLEKPFEEDDLRRAMIKALSLSHA